MADEMTDVQRITKQSYWRTRGGFYAYVGEQITQDGQPYWYGTIATVGTSLWTLDGHDSGGDGAFDLVTTLSQAEYQHGYVQAWRKERNDGDGE